MSRTSVRVVTAMTAAVAVAGVTACAAVAGGAGPDPGSGRDPGDPLAVVASFYPLEFVAERVGGDRVWVTGLAAPGADAHEAELTPSQVAEIHTADLVIYLSGFQPPVTAAVAEHAPEALDATTVVPLLGAPHAGAEPGGGAAGDGHSDHPDHGDSDHGDSDHGMTDPHVWLDPDRLARVTGAVADRLAGIDPAHAEAYATRAQALRADLAALDAAYTRGLASCQRREIVVSHAAFGYLADRYGLQQIAIFGLEPADEPSPRQAVAVVEEARAHGATTVYAEVAASPEVAELIAGEIGAATATLDPIESRTPGGGDYLARMEANLGALREGLGCR